MRLLLLSLFLTLLIPNYILSKANPSYIRAKIKHYAQRNDGLSKDEKTLYNPIEDDYEVENNSISFGNIDMSRNSNTKELNVNNIVDGLNINGKQKFSKAKARIMQKRDKESTISKIGDINLKDKKRVKNVYIYIDNVKVDVK